MFRNFVKPTSIDRLNTIVRNGDYNPVIDHAYRDSSDKDAAVSKPTPRPTTESRNGHSAPKDVKTLQPKPQNKCTGNTKDAHESSNYQNGIHPKPKSAINIPVNQKQIQHGGDKKTDGLPQQKSVSFYNGNLQPTSSIRPDTQRRRSIPSFTEAHFNNNIQNSHPLNDANSAHHTPPDKVRFSQQTNEEANISTKSTSDPRGKKAITPMNTHEDAGPEKPSRRTLYSQEKYNVVPPPPPLVEPVFAGRRDILHPASMHERQIVSMKGTVRGFKNRVRAGIATFWAHSEDKVFQHPSADQLKPVRNYRHLEQGRIVVYATSMSVVRETNERCKSVRRLLQNHMVRYEERDLYMSRDIQQELHQRLSSESISTIRLPHVFADGIHIGGADELEKLNEAGELRGLLDNYHKVIVRIMCAKCGGYRFLPCEFCHGSKKSLIRNHFTEEFCALRCMHCDENGLRRCDMCADQQE